VQYMMYTVQTPGNSKCNRWCTQCKHQVIQSAKYPFRIH